MEKNYKKGTTTVGVVCKDGVILAADKRASMGYLIANKEIEKIFKITDNIALTIAGVAADGQKLAEILRAEMELYEMNTDTKPNLTVASNLMSNIIFGRAKSFLPYIVQLILGGKDEGNSFGLFTQDPSGSNIKETKFHATGSGSPMAFGVLENNYKENISVDDGIKLVVCALASALKRDMATGEGVDVIIIDNKGFRRIGKDKIGELLKVKSINT
ncbi:archaeal proteasome endopeptidase complex subunit beta [Candidatus Woesearchaeota archaeon]|nr:archaeal proteasome endopeptidase complex subunit beta [Candidatus Woesearchaeota archaeon]